MLRALLMIAAVSLSGALGAWTPERWFEKPRSPRIANYRIEAALDWEAKALEGSETITWRNAGSVPTAEFPLHLYLNAFKGPQSLFMRESGGRLRMDRIGHVREAPSWGYCRLRSVKLDGQALGGHFGEDETVYWVKLPAAVPPGESIRVEIAWESRFPKVFARSGWGSGSTPREATFLMAGQWFPKVGVYQGDHWNCHAYHANTEFFSDFGTYDVDLSVPNALLLAHVGTQTNFQTEADVTRDPQRPRNVIWKLHAEDVHDFAWAAMTKRSWGYRRFDYRGVQVFCFYQPENLSQFDRLRIAIQSALRHSSDWFFPYPYPVLTVVDVPQGSEGADGMEYPTLITAGNIRFDPFRQRAVPEMVAVHEFGHQFFYGMLASNEFEEPWLDEGFTSWFTHKTLERTYQAMFASRRFQVGTSTMEWAEYWMDPSVDPLSQVGFQTRDGMSYGIAAYGKPTLVLDQLEALLGRPVMEQVMKAYAQEMAFKHPTQADFKRIAERVSNRDLTAFWRAFVEGTDTLDIAIREVATQPVMQGGWLDSPQGPVFAAPTPAAPGLRGRITLERKGGLSLPITLWVRLENKQEQRLLWDAQDRWVTYEFDSPVVAAVLDPDGNYPMLKDRLHASWTEKPVRRGFHYWAQLVVGALTGLMQGMGIG